MRILHVVGARPNFVKAAPVIRALEGHAKQTLVHTGQHYDPGMSAVFFDELDLPAPDAVLDVGPASPTVQTGRMLLGLDPLFGRYRPEACIVYGDVTSTVAGALAAAQHGVRLVHVEAGLRSGDRAMPEERNRVLVDHLADVLFTPSADANENLAREGVPAERIHFVGNVMIDSLLRALPRTDAGSVLARLGVPSGTRHVLATLHRPATVDEDGVLEGILGVLAEVSTRVPVIFPVHPRSRARLGASRGSPRAAPHRAAGLSRFSRARGRRGRGRHRLRRRAGGDDLPGRAVHHGPGLDRAAGDGRLGDEPGDRPRSRPPAGRAGGRARRRSVRRRRGQAAALGRADGATDCRRAHRNRRLAGPGRKGVGRGCRRSEVTGD